MTAQSKLQELLIKYEESSVPVRLGALLEMIGLQTKLSIQEAGLGTPIDVRISVSETCRQLGVYNEKKEFVPMTETRVRTLIKKGILKKYENSYLLLSEVLAYKRGVIVKTQ